MATASMVNTIGFIIVLIIKVKNAEEHLSYNNGWRPISNAKVLENFHRNFINTPNTINSTAFWSPIVSAKGNNENFELNNDLKPLDINRELMKKKFVVEMDDMQNEMFVNDQQRDYEVKYLENRETKPINNFAAALQRKSKKMFDEYDDINTIILNVKKENGDLKKDNEETKFAYDKSDYEVTEASEPSEVKDLSETKYSEEKQNSSYFKPTFKTSTEKNLSNKLFSILGNYNIRTNDDLPNYALSRMKYNSNLPKHRYGYISPIRTPPAHNSPNHFPINPLLAVLLSNYGYYLPGFYGFPSNYYNIYGYLASNNIHNNKPFGAYKIYSDTDSSH